MGHRHRASDDERGQVAVVVALSLTVMLAFGALVVDIGLSWAARSQAQTAADAASLAGVAELPGDPVAAVAAVKAYLNSNVPGLDDGSGWDANGSDADGDISCYRPPAAVPVPGTGCQVGDTAIQVITPPLEPTYAFAGILGKTSGEVKALATAGPEPGAVTPCALCLLDPDDSEALEVTGAGGITVSGSGVVVNSDAVDAAVLRAAGGVSAPSIGVVGGSQATGSGQFTPAVTNGIAPVEDPLSGLPTPDQIFGPLPNRGSVTVGNGSPPPLQSGVYDRLLVNGTGNLRLGAGAIIVVTGELTLSSVGSVLGGPATVYLSCFRYPQPCNGAGATLTLSSTGKYLATAPASGLYKGLSIFADRTNTSTISWSSSSATTFTGTIYAATGGLVLSSLAGTLQLNSLVVVGGLRISSTSGTSLSYSASQNAAITPPDLRLIK